MKYTLFVLLLIYGCDLRPQYEVDNEHAMQACIAHGGVPIIENNHLMKSCQFPEER